MLSAQIDRLRSCADLYDGTTKPEMAKELQRPYLAQELRGAANTIWQLRDDLQWTNAENARLRSELESVGTAAYLYGRGDLKAENAKLRELVQELYEGCMDSPCEDCPLKGKPACADCPIFAREVAVIYRMRELGVEAE